MVKLCCWKCQKWKCRTCKNKKNLRTKIPRKGLVSPGDGKRAVSSVMLHSRLCQDSKKHKYIQRWIWKGRCIFLGKGVGNNTKQSNEDEVSRLTRSQALNASLRAAACHILVAKDPFNQETCKLLCCKE